MTDEYADSISAGNEDFCRDCKSRYYEPDDSLRHHMCADENDCELLADARELDPDSMPGGHDYEADNRLTNPEYFERGAL
jgi:hypothetical protein